MTDQAALLEATIMVRAFETRLAAVTPDEARIIAAVDGVLGA